MEEDVIAVVVPVYKVEGYLDKCVESICQQTYENVEIILVDDGSPDRCPKMCDDWARRDGRIRVIHKENGGLSSARNAGLQATTAPYICFIDSDDYVSPDFLRTLYDDLLHTGSDMSVVDFVKFTSYDEIDMQSEDSDVVTFEGVDKYRQLYDAERGVSMVVAWNKLYKTAIFKDNDISYPVGRINEDEFVIHKILTACHKICWRNAQMYYYLQRSGSIMHQSYSEKNTHYIDALDQRTEFFRDYDKGLFYTSLSQLLGKIISDYFLKKDIKDLFQSKFDYIYGKYISDIQHLSKKMRLKIFLFRHFRLPLYMHYKKLSRKATQ